MKIITKSKEETQALAKELGLSLTKGTTILLFGNLGAGKTTFVQGHALGLDVTQKVNSPTFVIMKEYEGRIPLIHIDAYRLEGLKQDLGFEDYPHDEVVKVIEWPEYYYESDLYFNKITINTIDENTREIIFDFKDTQLLEAIQ